LWQDIGSIHDITVFRNIKTSTMYLYPEAKGGWKKSEKNEPTRRQVEETKPKGLGGVLLIFDQTEGASDQTTSRRGQVDFCHFSSYALAFSPFFHCRSPSRLFTYLHESSSKMKPLFQRITSKQYQSDKNQPDPFAPPFAPP
jgi:hypothetical protein